MESCYLDNNATTPLHPRIAEQLGLFMAESCCGNPSSLHSHGRAARKILEDARDKVAFFLGVDPAELFFTSGGTESNNLVIHGLAPLDGSLHVSATEHPSILEPATKQWKSGRPGAVIPVNSAGRVEDLALPDSGLVSIQWINNETGIAQDLPKLATAVHEQGGVLHTDGAQGFFRVPNVIPSLGIDMATITAHKSFGPPGVGALWVRKGLLMDPPLQGGPQEKKVRPGTENLISIFGMGLLADLALQQPLWSSQDLHHARQALLNELDQIPDSDVIEHDSSDWPGCVNVGFRGIHAETLLVRLDMVGISASSGSACSSGARELSHVLHAMKLDLERVRGSIRISLGPQNTPEQMSKVGQQIGSIVADLRQGN